MIHLPFQRATTFAVTVAIAALSVSACSGTATPSATSPTTAPSTTAPTTTAPSTTEAATSTSPNTSTKVVTAPDPCKVVTKSDAEKVVGTPLQAPTTAGGSDDKLCQYTGDPTGPTAQVAVFVGAGAKKALDLDRDTLQHDFTTLKGVGDEAYLESGNVFVRKGTVWVAVNVVALDAPEADVQAALTKLASTIAGRR